MSGTTKQPPQHHPDDIAVWPDGAYATLKEVWRGEFSHRSDDFEIVRLEDVARLKELGLADDLDLS
ncbi:MAG TPA: hypothetical protein VIQ29_09235 [Ancylobacter sp.]|uniref:hypothetical protein n=1 Tax=Xanthobacter autotrophicus TaxID=280 RepID=UPI002FA43366